MLLCTGSARADERIPSYDVDITIGADEIVAPALVPVVGGFPRGDLDQGVARGRLQVGQARQLARRAVHGVLDDLAEIDLLHAGRREREQLGEDALGVVAPDAHAEADHTPSARFSLENMPSP